MDDAIDGPEDLADTDEDMLTCPMPCSHCRPPAGCEDCLDCLYWPEVLDHTPGLTPAPTGPMAPVRSQELETERAALDVGSRIGLVSRRFRREHALSQRQLADALGWHHSTLARAEIDATPLTIRRALELLRHIGYRLAIVPDDDAVAQDLGEDPDQAWGAPDLIARDGRGRRLPPFGRVTWHSDIDRRLHSRVVKHEAEWTWRRPTG